MIFVAAAIEDDRGDALLFPALGDQFADGFGRLNVPALFQVSAQAGVQRRRCRQSASGRIVYQLRIDVLQAARYVQARTLCRPVYLITHAAMPLFAKPLLVFQSHPYLFLSRWISDPTLSAWRSHQSRHARVYYTTNTGCRL